MAADDLTALPAVKAWLGLTLPSQTTDDDLLTGLITAASGFMRRVCSRQFVSQDYTETRDGVGGRRMVFANTPVTAVASLTIGGQTVPVGDAVSAPGYYFTPAMLMLNGRVFDRGFGNVQIAYTAGFTTIPEDLAQACIELVSLRYKERKRIGLTSEGLANNTTSYSQRDMPASVATLLATYTKVVPL